MSGTMSSSVISFFRNQGMRVCVLVALYCISGAAEDLTLLAFVLPGAPIVNKQEKKVLYGLDLVFNAEPKDFWLYYSSAQKKLVLDFYGIHITGKPKLDFPGRSVFKDYKIVNSDTRMSLKNKKASIYIGMDPDPRWVIKAVVIDKRIVRITAWKDIAQLTRVTKKKKRNPFVLYMVLTILAASIAFVAVAIIDDKTN